MFNSKELKVFTGFLHSSMETQLRKLVDILIKDEKYQKLCDEKLEIFKRIVFELTDDSKLLFMKYLDKESEISYVVQAKSYELGFKDAAMFMFTLLAEPNRQEFTDLSNNMPKGQVH